MPDKWIGAFPALIADIALRAIPVKRRFEIFSKMLLNPDNIGTDKIRSKDFFSKFRASSFTWHSDGASVFNYGDRNDYRSGSG